MIAIEDKALLRAAMSRAYCAKLKTILSDSDWCDMLNRMGEAERESRCASERYGIDSGALMKAVWFEVSGDSAASQDFDIDAYWIDGRKIRGHFQGAFELNRIKKYWTEG